MKKTLVALAVLTAAGSANAGIDLYNDNGVNVTLSGAAEVQYLQTIQNSDGKSDDAGLHLDDGDIQLNTTVAVTDKLNAVAGIGFAFEKTDVTNDELWVGLANDDFGTVTFGRQMYISDDMGIGKDYELGLEQVDFVKTEGNEAIKYVFDNGTFYFGATHDLDAAKADGTAGGTDFLGADGTVTDVRLGARFADFDVRGYYYTAEDLSNTDVDAFNLEAEYVMDAFAFAASYGQVEYTDSTASADKTDVDVFEINGSYTLGKNTFALGYNRADASVKNNGAYKTTEDVVDNVYANVTHQLHSNVKVYAELGYADGDNTDYDMGYLAGMEVKF
ncbi:porin [Photobacterium frigidiphilum]|uniref:porin n=1 Tax=Photobacterium frigidiphilum TaxID=264736 RepID=UPI003D1200AA